MMTGLTGRLSISFTEVIKHVLLSFPSVKYLVSVTNAERAYNAAAGGANRSKVHHLAAR